MGCALAGSAIFSADAVPIAAVTALSAYERPASLVRVPGGTRINFRCLGAGGPTIILTAGAGEQSLTWHDLQSKLAKNERVCAWDRPGFGFSDPTSAPMDVVHLTSSLEAALKAGAIKPPFLLVGHSLGSFETLMLAFRRPRDVAGIVLIDPAGPFQDNRFKKAAPSTYAVINAIQKDQTDQLRQCIDAAKRRASISSPTQIDQCAGTPVKTYPPKLNDVLIRMDGEVERREDYLSLLDNMFSDLDSRELISEWHQLGSMPMIVLTAGDPPPIPLTPAARSDIGSFVQEWSSIHDDMARLSTKGINRRVEHAKHYIYLDQPTAVLEAIHEVVSAARANAAHSKNGL